MVKKLLVCGLGIALGGCYQPMKPSDGHLREQASAPTAAQIPPPVQSVPAPPRPKPTTKAETYSVVVNNVPVRELLFALARDAKVNVDVHPGITGTVTLNAIDQTLPQLLSRISRQVDMRYEFDGPNLMVMPDSPFLRIYKIDYVNMQRETRGTVSVAGNVISGATTGGAGGAGGAGGGAGAGGANASTVSVRNEATNRFWETLHKNVEEILRETDKVLPGASPGAPPAAPGQPAAGGGGAAGTAAAQPGAGPNVTFREASSVISNAEAGVLTIRATSRQHEKIQEFLDQILVSARRQVLIEATIVEVALNNNYQQGIDWNYMGSTPFGISARMQPQGQLGATPTGSIFTLAYNSNVFNMTIRLLEQFGTVRVISSPRLSVINNQTALLKVVENVVYFTISSQTSQAQTTSLTTFTTTPNVVAVGLVMNLTPQISDSNVVLLNVKPTLSRVLSFVNDPNPSLANPCGGNVTSCSIPPIVSQVPQIQTRELESVIKVASGDVAVLGGLIQDGVNNIDDTIPGVNRIPIIGDIFQNRNLKNSKTELVVFLRPVVIKDASLDGDYRGYRIFVPGEDFLSEPNPGRRICDFRLDPGCPR